MTIYVYPRALVVVTREGDGRVVAEVHICEIKSLLVGLPLNTRGVKICRGTEKLARIVGLTF